MERVCFLLEPEFVSFIFDGRGMGRIENRYRIQYFIPLQLVKCVGIRKGYGIIEQLTTLFFTLSQNGFACPMFPQTFLLPHTSLSIIQLLNHFSDDGSLVSTFHYLFPLCPLFLPFHSRDSNTIISGTETQKSKCCELSFP